MVKRLLNRYTRLLTPRIKFFLVLLLTALPILLFPLYSHLNHAIHGSPQVRDGVLDLAGYDFRHDGELPLDGEWEFFWSKWIVSDNEPDAKPDFMAYTPLSWNWYKLDGKNLPDNGYGSYRLQLKNCPEDVVLVSYVPNLGAAYRVYLNGTLITGSGMVSKNPEAITVSLGLIREQLSTPLKKDSELVIEVCSTYVGGLYMAPILTEAQSDYMRSGIRYIIAAVYIGILLVTIGCAAYILLTRDTTFHTAALLALDVLVFLRILVKDEFFGILKMIFPVFRYYEVNAAIQILTMFLPAFFLLCVKDMVDIPVEKNEIKKIVLYELICSVPMYFFMVNGLLYAQHFLCMISFAPFIPVVYKLYRSACRGAPYSIVVSAGALLTLSCLIVANQTSSGLFVMNLSLYPPTCFVLGVLLQNYVYMKKNSEMHKEALEAVNLRLRLKESETTLMLSQIKPHFLYNALIAIQVLCTREPETAEEALIKFAKYLRANMQSINSREPIPFERELEHIRNYVSIEQLRFRDRLSIVYDIGPVDFRVPPLTIQPLVENAIKHGACRNVMGGTVSLKTWEDDASWFVQVRDDGPGFDVSTLEGESEQSVGLRNILFRLKELAHARVEIQSGPDQGTEVLVQLPKPEPTERNDRADEGDHC